MFGSIAIRDRAYGRDLGRRASQYTEQTDTAVGNPHTVAPRTQIKVVIFVLEQDL